MTGKSPTYARTRKPHQLISLSKIHKKTKLFDFREVLSILVKSKIPNHTRALRLAEFIIAIYYLLPSMERRSHDEFGEGFEVPVFKVPFDRARLFALMQLMDLIIARDPTRRGNQGSAMVRSMKVSFFNLYDEFGEFGGWKKACRIGSPRAIQRRIEREEIKLRVAAAFVEFSLHVKPEQLTIREKGGYTAALRVLGDDGYMHSLVGYAASKETIKQRWLDARRVAVFAYLMFFSKLIPKINFLDKDFPQTIINWCETTENAKKVVATYNIIAGRLNDKDYINPTLCIPIWKPQPAIELSPSPAMSKIPRRPR